MLTLIDFDYTKLLERFSIQQKQVQKRSALMEPAITLVNRFPCLLSHGVQVSAVSFVVEFLGSSHYLIDYPYRPFVEYINQQLLIEGLDFVSQFKRTNEGQEGITYFYYSYTCTQRGRQATFGLNRFIASSDVYHLFAGGNMKRKDDLLKWGHFITYGPFYEFSEAKLDMLVIWKSIKIENISGVLVVIFNSYNNLSDNINSIILEIDQSVIPIIEWRAGEIASLLISDFFLFQALRSAIAAIMSRNMSHNIGSHVLARIVTGGIGGWTEKLGVEDIVKKLTVDCLIKQLDEALQSKQVNTDPCQALKERLNSYRNFPDPVRDRPYVTSEQARSLVTWGKDVQFLARYLQQRMDFIAQISTEWPTWSEPTWFMRDMMRWFLSQKHLLDNIARSDGLKAHLYEQSSTGATSTACSPSSSAASPAPGSPTQGDADGTQANQTQNAASAYQQEQEPGDIRLHVFLAPKDCWNKTCKSSGDRVRARRDQIKSGCTKDAAQLPCKCDRDGSGQPCEHCHRILLYTSKDSVECCLGKDFQVAVPGGIVGQHAFFTILENIIRNAAKHGYARQKGQLDHLDVVIEVLYDPEERVAVQNLEDDQPKRIPAHLLRIYTNVSPVEGEGAVVSLDKINGILGKGIIKETGEMEKANWGHAEMKIAVGYLQRREIMHIGGQGQEITGESSKTMLELGESENGSRAIIRAVESPIGTLGYEFYIPRPRTVGIVCPEGGAS